MGDLQKTNTQNSLKKKKLREVGGKRGEFGGAGRKIRRRDCKFRGKKSIKKGPFTGYFNWTTGNRETRERRGPVGGRGITRKERQTAIYVGRVVHGKKKKELGGSTSLRLV